MIELRHLRYFVAVAEDLHFGRAARRLRIAQPPLSQQIRQLERTLGTPLLVRNTRKVALTPAGTELLGGARRTLAELDRAIDDCRRVASQGDRTLRVGHTAHAAAAVMPRIIERFRAEIADCTLELTEDSSQGNFVAVSDGALDAAFIAGSATARLEGNAVRSLVVHRERLVAAVPAAHRLARRSEISLGALANEPMVMFPRRLAPGFYDQIAGFCAQAGFVPRIVRRAAGYDRIIMAVAEGRVVSLVPQSIKRQRSRQVRFVRIVEPVSVTIDVVYTEPVTSPMLRAFLAASTSLGSQFSETQVPARFAHSLAPSQTVSQAGPSGE